MMYDDNDDVIKNKKTWFAWSHVTGHFTNKIIPKQQGKQGGLGDCHEEAEL